ncbi:MAG: CvpA family protein [Cytophagaceae bacterium]|nr:CvpA family protein [Cytophagaceae bacterium]
MKIIDILLIILILVGAYLGYKKGLLVEVLTFFAFIIAIISAFKVMHLAVSWFFPEKNPDSILPFISFIIIFLLVFIAMFFLAKFLKKILDYTLLGKFDSWAGAIVGACKMAFGISLLLWLIYHAQIPIPGSVISDSVIYPNLVSFAPKVVAWVSYIIPFQDVFALIKQSL